MSIDGSCAETFSLVHLVDLVGHSGSIEQVCWEPLPIQSTTDSHNTSNSQTINASYPMPYSEVIANASSSNCASSNSMAKSTRIATICSADKSVRLWDATTGLPIGPAVQTSGENINMAWSPDTRWLAIGTKCDNICLLSVSPSGISTDLSPPMNGTTNGKDNTVGLTLIRTLQCTAEVNELAWNASSSHLFVAYGTGNIQVFELFKGMGQLNQNDTTTRNSSRKTLTATGILNTLNIPSSPPDAIAVCKDGCLPCNNGITLTTSK